jgi:hypothetical protein
MISCVSKLGNSTGVKLSHANLKHWDDAHERHYQQTLKAYKARQGSIPMRVCDTGDLSKKMQMRLKYL